MSPRSFRMGMSVPNAVVVNAMAMVTDSSSLENRPLAKCTKRNARTMDTHQVASPRLPWLPVRLFGLIS